MSKKYLQQSLLDAVNSTLDPKSAAKFYNVPASTIRSHRRNSSLRSRVGRPSYLSSTEESYLVGLLQLLPEYGIQVTGEVALKLANDYFKSLGLSDTPGKKWLHSFVERNGDHVKWKKQSKLERAREEGFTEKVRSGWFTTLENVMIKYDLLDKPNQIFNVDETGFSDQTKGEWVIVKSSRRHVFETNGGKGKAYRTALICVSAGGFVLSPLFLYSGKHLMDSWCTGGPSGAHYGITTKGWMDTAMFEYWLEHIFISSTAHINRPLLLIFDGYSSHFSLKIVNLLKANNIICLMLPAHSTHALQPVDIVLFNSVKSDWVKIVKNHLKDGIWPFNKHAMRDKVASSGIDFDSKIIDDSTPVPTDVLSPPSHSSAFTPLFVSSTNNSMNDANETTTQFTTSSPVQPVMLDYDDVPPLLNNPSYTDLQSCTTDVIFEEPQYVKQTASSCEEKLNQNHQENSFNITVDDASLPSPLIAVRQVMHEMFCQRKEENRLVTTNSKPIRGSRLKSVVGLNITEDELVLLKLEEKEEKKNRIKKNRMKKGGGKTTISTKSTSNNKNRTRSFSSSMTNKENRPSKDPEIAFGIQTLQNAINSTQDILSDSSDDESSLFIC